MLAKTSPDNPEIDVLLAIPSDYDDDDDDDEDDEDGDEDEDADAGSGEATHGGSLIDRVISATKKDGSARGAKSPKGSGRSTGRRKPHDPEMQKHALEKAFKLREAQFNFKIAKTKKLLQEAEEKKLSYIAKRNKVLQAFPPRRGMALACRCSHAPRFSSCGHF